MIRTKEAVKKFADSLVKEGLTVNIDNVNYEKLSSDISSEYESGADGSIYDVIVDLNESVGLEEYGIIIE